MTSDTTTREPHRMGSHAPQTGAALTVSVIAAVQSTDDRGIYRLRCVADCAGIGAARPSARSSAMSKTTLSCVLFGVLASATAHAANLVAAANKDFVTAENAG